MKLHTGQVGPAGEHYVAAEIHRRGGYAVTFSGNMKGIDLAGKRRRASAQDFNPSEDEDIWDVARERGA